MRTRVKICCIASVVEARMAIAAGADALGLVAAMPSGPGSIPDSQIAQITAFAPPTISTFLLTGETTAAAISAHVRATRPTAVQIVSHIDPQQSAELAALEPHVKRVQVIHVEGSECIELMHAYAPHVDAFLLDSGRPGAAVPELGGTGRKHDWFISKHFIKGSPKAVFLAGGVNEDNVREAILDVSPFGLDLCSSVRTDGALDPAKLTAFMRAVRKADQEAMFR